MKRAAELTNVDIVVYVVATLSGAERSVHSEDVAARSFALAPARFSWRKSNYKDWPDKYVVKTALEDAKKVEQGALVEGVYALDLSKDGWQLTAQGARWFREHRLRIESTLKVKQPAIPRKDRERFKRLLATKPLFQEFRRSKTVPKSSVYQFTDMLNCSPDASPDIVAMKFGRMKATAELVQDPDILAFLAACGESFPKYTASPNQSSDSEVKE